MATTYSYRFGEFLQAIARRELWRAGTLVRLSPRAFDCLVYLIEHRDRAVDKDELVAAIWHRSNVSDTQLGQTVLRARRAVGDDGQEQRIIRTVARFGYRWIAETNVVPDIDTAADVAAPAVEEPVITASEPERERKRFAPIAAIILLVVVLAGIALVAHWRSHAPASEKGDVAVLMPLSVQATTGNAWLRLGAMDLIAERLRTGGLSVPPSESIVALLQSLSGNEDVIGSLRRTTAAEFVVHGEAVQTQQGWTVKLTAADSHGASLAVEATNADALRAASDAADRLLGRLGRSPKAISAINSAAQDRLQRAQEIGRAHV